MDTSENGDAVTAGALLLAAPMMLDPNFRRSVVLVCEHNHEGSFGLIVNRPLPFRSETLDEVLGENTTTIAFGGPVQPNTLHYVHRLPEAIPDAEPVANGIFWGGSFDHVRDAANVGILTDQQLRFFLGYAGWGPGQLQEEVDHRDWIVASLGLDLIFDVEADKLWSVAMRKLGGEYAVLANFPSDPRLN